MEWNHCLYNTNCLKFKLILSGCSLFLRLDYSGPYVVSFLINRQKGRIYPLWQMKKNETIGFLHLLVEWIWGGGGVLRFRWVLAVLWRVSTQVYGEYCTSSIEFPLLPSFLLFFSISFPGRLNHSWWLLFRLNLFLPASWWTAETTIKKPCPSSALSEFCSSKEPETTGKRHIIAQSLAPLFSFLLFVPYCARGCSVSCPK